MFRILLLILGVSFLNSTVWAAAAAEGTERRAIPGTFRVALFNPLTDTKDLRGIAAAHAGSSAAGMLDFDFKAFMGEHKARNDLVAVKMIDPLFGNYGLYHQEEGGAETMVGILSLMVMKVNQIVPDYAECSMLMRPDKRGKGYGRIFRDIFNKTFVLPNVGKSFLPFIGEMPGSVPMPFQGVKGYVLVENMASRRMLTAAGYQPYDLCNGVYQKKVEKAQIIYVYPPSRKPKLPAALIAEIRSNDPAYDARLVEHAVAREKAHKKDGDDMAVFLEKAAAVRDARGPKEGLMALLAALMEIENPSNGGGSAKGGAASGGAGGSAAGAGGKR